MSHFQDEGSDRKTVTILLVEDDKLDVKAIRKALTAARIANPLYVANDGIEALELLRGEAVDAAGKPIPAVPQPYLILLDLNLPRMNGLEFLEELRSDPSLRASIVFVLTTSDDDRDIIEAYDKFIAGYMVKAKAGDDFVELISMLDHYWRIVEFPIER